MAVQAPVLCSVSRSHNRVKNHYAFPLSCAWSSRSSPMYIVFQSSRNKFVAATHEGHTNRKDQSKMAKREVRKRHFLFVMWDGAGGTIVEARIIKNQLRRGNP